MIITMTFYFVVEPTSVFWAVEPKKHSNSLIFPVHLQAEKAGRRRGEKEA